MVSSIRAAFCLPALRGPDSTDTSFLQQRLIAERLAALGCTIDFLAPSGLEDVVTTRDLREIHPVRRTWSASAWFRTVRRAAWKVQQVLGVPYLNYFANASFYDAYLRCLPGFDIVHERNGVFRSAVAMACRRLGLPYILFFDGDDILEHTYTGRALGGILLRRAASVIRYNLAAADRVICVSETGKRRLAGAWQVPEEKIEVFPNGVDVDLYRPAPETAVADRAALGVGAAPLLIFVGSFYPWHDARVLLDAFAQVRAQKPGARLWMVGDGERCAEAKAAARDLGLDGSVQFTGFLSQAEVARRINAADIAVAPYTRMDPAHFIGSPMKLFEYMAMGKAVIASRMGQVEEIVEDGVNGVLVEPGSAPDLAAALLSLIDQPDLRSQLGKQARIDAAAGYSWDRYAARLADLYERVIAEKGRSPLTRERRKESLAA